VFNVADGIRESSMENTSTEQIVTEYKQVYKGRRNVQTFLKEVAFFL